MRGVLAIRLSSDERAALARAADAEGVRLSSFVRDAALAAALTPASRPDEYRAASEAREKSEQVPESLEEVMERVWGSTSGLAWWERDALGIPPSEDYWAWRRRVRGY